MGGMDWQKNHWDRDTSSILRCGLRDSNKTELITYLINDGAGSSEELDGEKTSSPVL